MYYVVTGAAGFIGSRIVEALNRAGVSDIIAVDNLSRSAKVANLTRLLLAPRVPPSTEVIQAT